MPLKGLVGSSVSTAVELAFTIDAGVLTSGAVAVTAVDLAFTIAAGALTCGAVAGTLFKLPLP